MCCSPTSAELAALTAARPDPRRDCQFHWFNRGYAVFDEFLATFTAEKRKKAKRERRRVAEAGIEFDTRWAARWTKRSGTPSTSSTPTPSIATATSPISICASSS